MSDLLGVATLIGVLAAVVGLSQVRKARKREFEDMFVQRYWSISDRLSTAALESIHDGRPVLDEDRRAVIAYLQLSEDQLDLRRSGWISTDTWKLWRAGISTQLRRWPFDVVWAEVSERESHATESGQFAMLRGAGHRIHERSYDSKAERRWVPWLGR